MKIPKILNSNGTLDLNAASISDNDPSSGSAKKGSIFGIRHLQCFLLFLGLSIAYALRVNLSVAIVAMTDSSSSNPHFDEYNWSEKTKSVLLSSFFWGYVITQIPAGSLARKFGGKVMFLAGVLVCSLMAILTPICARIGNWKLVCALRVLQGLSQGVVFPSTHTILSKWSPVEERGSLTTYCYSGSQFGTVVMLASSGVLASSVMGWPSIFYISGGCGVVWSVLFFVWGASSPTEYKSLSAEERKLIETSLGPGEGKESPQQPLKTPWLKFFTSPPFLTLILVHSAHNWGFWTLLTEIPTYMKNVLGKDIKSNALLSALPYLAMLVLCFVFSFVAGQMAKRRCLALSTSRKLFNTIGHWVPMVSLVALGYVGPDNTNLAIALLTITVGINAATYLGFQVNHIDLSPNFAGILMGITNCAANIMSIIAPLIVGFIVTDEKNADQWRIIFFIAGGFYFVGNLMFILFGQAEIQPWNAAQPAGKISSSKRGSVFVESQH